MHTLPDTLSSFVQRISSAGFEVWLMGSRANDNAKVESDWDLLIFGDNTLLNCLEQEQPPENSDVLVVYDGDAFRSPWNKTDDGVIKSGSLSGWEWRKASETEATYSGTKWPHDWGSTKRSTRISP